MIREYMVPWTAADQESIALINKAVADLASLGAEIVDPGQSGELFRKTIEELVPYVEPELLPATFPNLFTGIPIIDQIVNLFFNRGLFPTGLTAPSIRNPGPAPTTGETKYMLNRYLRERGNANIKTIQDLIDKARFWNDLNVATPPRQRLVTTNSATTLEAKNKIARRFTLQQIVHQLMAALDLDALVYPTKSVPAPKLTAPVEPTVGDRSALAFTVLPANGFPALSVPAGFTSVVFDRARPAPGQTGDLISPIPARLPVNIDFLGLPFSEPMLLSIAAAYESATQHREVPVGFPALAEEP